MKSTIRSMEKIEHDHTCSLLCCGIHLPSSEQAKVVDLVAPSVFAFLCIDCNNNNNNNNNNILDTACLTKGVAS